MNNRNKTARKRKSKALLCLLKFHNSLSLPFSRLSLSRRHLGNPKSRKNHVLPPIWCGLFSPHCSVAKCLESLPLFMQPKFHRDIMPATLSAQRNIANVPQCGASLRLWWDCSIYRLQSFSNYCRCFKVVGITADWLQHTRPLPYQPNTLRRIHHSTTSTKMVRIIGVELTLL